MRTSGVGERSARGGSRGSTGGEQSDMQAPMGSAWRVTGRLCAAWVIGAVTLAGCGGDAPRVKAAGALVAKPSVCLGEHPQAKPFIVEWEGADRAALEGRAQRG